MCDFNSLNSDQKEQYHIELTKCAESFGGRNFFLQLLEEIRETKPHPLTAISKEFSIDVGIIKWNKVIFNDKLLLLQKARTSEKKQNNLLPKEGAKGYKKILNLLRTLKPIVFTVKPQKRDVGNGFMLQPFVVIDENTTKINPLFDALFFCSMDVVKRILSYEPRETKGEQS
jgi:hypothetical protein